MKVNEYTKSEIKQLLFEVLGDKCNICGETRFLTLDHIVAKYKGGENKLKNAQLLCKKCHEKKNGRELSERLTNNCGLMNPTHEPQRKKNLSKSKIKMWSTISEEERAKYTEPARTTSYKIRKLRKEEKEKNKVHRTKEELRQLSSFYGKKRFFMMTKQEKTKLAKKGAKGKWDKLNTPEKRRLAMRVATEAAAKKWKEKTKDVT